MLFIFHSSFSKIHSHSAYPQYSLRAIVLCSVCHREPHKILDLCVLFVFLVIVCRPPLSGFRGTERQPAPGRLSLDVLQHMCCQRQVDCKAVLLHLIPMSLIHLWSK